MPTVALIQGTKRKVQPSFEAPAGSVKGKLTKRTIIAVTCQPQPNRNLLRSVLALRCGLLLFVLFEETGIPEEEERDRG